MAHVGKLRKINRFITTHNDKGKAIFSDALPEESKMEPLPDGRYGFALSVSPQPSHEPIQKSRGPVNSKNNKLIPLLLVPNHRLPNRPERRRRHKKLCSLPNRRPRPLRLQRLRPKTRRLPPCRTRNDAPYCLHRLRRRHRRRNNLHSRFRRGKTIEERRRVYTARDNARLEKSVRDRMVPYAFCFVTL